MSTSSSRMACCVCEDNKSNYVTLAGGVKGRRGNLLFEIVVEESCVDGEDMGDGVESFLDFGDVGGDRGDVFF